MSKLQPILNMLEELSKRGKVSWEELFRSLREVVEKGREAGGEVVYLPIDEEARRVLKEYLAVAKPSRELEKRVMGIVLKYLILNCTNLEVCTELEMSKRLGIPRQRLRKLLGLLEWEEIIVSFEVGATKPYVAVDLSKAIREGYLSFTREEMEGLAKIIPWLDRISISRLDVEAEMYNPQSQIFYMLYQSIPSWDVYWRVFTQLWNLMLGRESGFFIYIPPFKAPILQDEVKPSVEWMAEAAGVFQDIKLLASVLDFMHPLFVRDVLFELNVPDEVSEEQVEEAFTRLVEKYVKAVSKIFQPLCNLLKEYNISELKPVLDKWRSSEKAGRHLATGGLFGVKEMRWMVTGDYQFRGDWATPVREEHVALALAILKAAGRVGEFIGISKETLSLLNKEISVLEKALERNEK